MKIRTVYFAIPVMNEPNLAETLQSIDAQNYSSIEVYLFVNQPQSFYFMDDKQGVIDQNLRTLQDLGAVNQCGFQKVTYNNFSFPLWVVDACSNGKAMDDKHIGVGWARKILMDKIAEQAQSHDIIISADADTIYPFDYAMSVVNAFDRCPYALGMANPYYHQLTENEDINRSILRYEIYMRSYNIHLMKIKSPYGYTAMGSAMSCTIAAYKKVNGLTPHKSGEDFYFLQKLVKSGKMLINNKVCVFPSSRNSDRVFFGTGPAVSKGLQDNWSSYPIYPFVLFENIRNYLEELGKWYDGDSLIQSDVHAFFIEKFGSNWWLDLKKNAKTRVQFQKFCNEKIDGLRLLQYFKASYCQNDEHDFKNIPLIDKLCVNHVQPFKNVAIMNEIRNYLKDIESKMQEELDFDCSA